jgi:imidazolonepropionase-like amidohydrolase
VQRGLRSGGMDIPDDKTQAKYDRSYQKMIAFVGELHKAGIRVVPGTDAMAGFTLHRELELYVQAGMTPAEALMAATRVSAEVARVERERGQIAPGYDADLVLIDGDPTADISAIRNIALVISRGEAITKAWVSSRLCRRSQF